MLTRSLNVVLSDRGSPTVSGPLRCYVEGSTWVPRLVENFVPSCGDEPSMVMAFVAVMQGGNS